MNCLICRQSGTVDGATSISFERGEMLFVVHHVPARICPNCGEAYVSEDVADRLLQYAEHKVMDGDINDIQEYVSL